MAKRELLSDLKNVRKLVPKEKLDEASALAGETGLTSERLKEVLGTVGSTFFLFCLVRSRDKKWQARISPDTRAAFDKAMEYFRGSAGELIARPEISDMVDELVGPLSKTDKPDEALVSDGGFDDISSISGNVMYMQSPIGLVPVLNVQLNTDQGVREEPIFRVRLTSGDAAFLVTGILQLLADCLKEDDSVFKSGLLALPVGSIRNHLSELKGHIQDVEKGLKKLASSEGN